MALTALWLAVPGNLAQQVVRAGAMGLTGATLAVALGGLVVGPLIYFFAREARGHGVPEVMAAVALRGGVIRRRVVAIVRCR